MEVMEDDPDYTDYSLEDLYDVAKHINRGKYPERYKVLVQEIARREQTQLAQPKLKSAPLSLASPLSNFILGGVLGVLTGGLLGFLALMLIIEIGPASAKANLDAATGMGGITVIFAVVGGIVGAIKGATRAVKQGLRK
jgi:hypothetical protein